MARVREGHGWKDRAEGRRGQKARWGNQQEGKLRQPTGVPREQGQLPQSALRQTSTLGTQCLSQPHPHPTLLFPHL